VSTFARVDPARARFAGRAAFAIEIAALAFLLQRAGSPLPFVLLFPYALLELARVRTWGVRLIVVAPAPSFRIAMLDYYVVFYPLAFLVACTIRRSADLVVLAVHAALFRDVPAMVARDTKIALKGLTAQLRTAAMPPGRSRS
jgi:hypothetical protein